MNRPFIYRRPFAPVLVAATVAAGSLFLSACGDGDESDPASAATLPDGAIAQVADVPISESTYQRRLKAELRGISPLEGTTGSSRIIDPPRFERCASDLRKLSTGAPGDAPRGQSPTVPTNAQLRENCRQQYQQIQSDTVTELIEEQWVIQSAAEDGFELPDEEIQGRLDQLEATQTARLKTLLQASGLQRVDLEDQLRASLAGQRSLLELTSGAESSVGRRGRSLLRRKPPAVRDAR